MYQDAKKLITRGLTGNARKLALACLKLAWDRRKCSKDRTPLWLGEPFSCSYRAQAQAGGVGTINKRTQRFSGGPAALAAFRDLETAGAVVCIGKAGKAEAKNATTINLYPLLKKLEAICTNGKCA